MYTLLSLDFTIKLQKALIKVTTLIKDREHDERWKFRRHNDMMLFRESEGRIFDIPIDEKCTFGYVNQNFQFHESIFPCLQKKKKHYLLKKEIDRLNDPVGRITLFGAD